MKQRSENIISADLVKCCRLSIVVVCYKNPQLTLSCLRSILSFAPPFAHEIICVDNGSADGVEGCIAKDFPDVRFFQAGYNSGFSKASNLGINNSRGEYILLLNNDIEITEPIFDRMVEFMDAHPGTGALGPRHLDDSGRFQVSYGRFPTVVAEMKLKIMNRRILRGDPSIFRHLQEFCSKERGVDWLSASCLLLRREALRQTGLLDESLFMYFEDVDICKRITNKGWGIRYFPGVSVVHYHGKTVKENPLKCFFEYRRSQLLYAKKYHGRTGEAVMRAFLFSKFSAVGCWNIMRFCVYKILSKDTQSVYMRTVLSNKVVTMVFSSKMAEPIEPTLYV